MLNKNSLPISYQVDLNVPGFVKTDHQKFVQFLVNYYEYLDQNENINDYIRNVISFMDVDTTTEFLLNNFFEELREMPYSVVSDKRLLAQHIIDLYSSKGSIDSFKLLFRLLFNESIEVMYPSEKILRASDGRWTQESFIELDTIFGGIELSNEVVQFFFENQYGKFKISPSKIEQLTWSTHRIHYDSKRKTYINNDQTFYVYGTNGLKEYIGRIKKAPARLKILNGGKFWQVGAIIAIPGVGSDTIARVSRVDSQGVIAGVEILQFGAGHTENQITTISPFPNKPLSSGVTITSTLISFSPPVYDHSIEINDYTDGIDESIFVSTVEVGETSYFAENYQADDYNATIKVEINTIGDTSSGSDVPTDITIQDWLASRATFVYEYDYIVKEKGYYTSDHSMISNSEIRLQDGFYYQLYSYVIQTSNNLEDYKKALSLIHPAGLKYFAELKKEFVHDITDDITVFRSMSVDGLYLNDVVEMTEFSDFAVDKSLADMIEAIDYAPVWLTKPFDSSVTPSDASVKDFIKVFNEMLSATDYPTKTVDKALDDSYTAEDASALDITKPFDDSVDGISDSDDLTVNKSLSDSVTPTHASASLNIITYMVDLNDYFTSDYMQTEKILTIS